MKTNLSSLIKLDRISRRYYDPQNDIERTELTRLERVYTRIFETPEDGSKYIAERIVKNIRRAIEVKGKCVMALGAGRSTHNVYSELIKLYEQGEISFKRVIVFNISEFFPLEPNGPSTLQKLHEVFLDHIDIPQKNIHSINPNITRENMYDYCREYERTIEYAGGLDMTICEIGRDGQLAFNQTGSVETTLTRLVLLPPDVRQDIANDYKCEIVPSTAITMGIKNLLNATRVITMAWGENYAPIIKKVVEEPASATIPASFLQGHDHARVVVDIPAADDLARISKPWTVTSCEWDNKLIRRAIVWLCRQTGKVILKLTDKDYNDHGLGELLALHGSAYNTNIKVFNELQHTITGWPGGKPGADDSNRPERALPYPKRVIVFSPHPDDDVISMGATLHRLVEQGHDVHVAYETSGNIAVGDEDMMRYFIMFDKINPVLNVTNDNYKDLTAKMYEFLRNKQAGTPDLPEIREIKTMIRQAEATIACHHIGIPDDHIHFLRLPFYETGTIKKGELTEKDIEIVQKLIEEIKPNQIFVAGDLADPHGTHRVCTDAVLAAVYNLRKEPWMQECRIWMYRGAWAEWEIDHIEMAVPISPEQLRFKRNSILKHQSQMENAPFLGDDDRLFWQRAEERNRATAQLYHELGLASYEAMEAFVQYHQPKD